MNSRLVVDPIFHLQGSSGAYQRCPPNRGKIRAPLLRIFGLLPASGGALLAILVGNALLTGAILTIGAISFQAMIADAADEHEHLFGVRREALFFAGLTLASKAATALGSLIAGVALDLIGFPTTQIAAHTAYHLTPAVVARLGLVAGPLPAVVALLSPLCLLSYRLSAARLAALQQDFRRTPVQAGDAAAAGHRTETRSGG